VNRPRYRGLPIPFIALVRPDGKPDFRVVDEEARRRVLNNRWCQLCGEPLGKWVFFIGGTEAAKANHYFEPPTHLDCVIYAMQVCPFIVGRIEHVDLGKIEKEYEGKTFARSVTDPASGRVGIQVHADETFSAVRNPYWVIKKAADWHYALTPDRTLLVVPEAVNKTTEPLHAESMSAADWEKVEQELIKNE